MLTEGTPMPHQVLDLDLLHLERGGHETPDDGLCLLEAAAFVAGEPHTDHPASVSPVLGRVGRELNDKIGEDRRQALKPLIPLLPGTAGDGLDPQRSYLGLDWLVRTHTPTWLDVAGLTVDAATLRGLPVYAGPGDSAAALSAVRACCEAAMAAVGSAAKIVSLSAWYAARDAARTASDATVLRDYAGEADSAVDDAVNLEVWYAARGAAEVAAWRAVQAAPAGLSFRVAANAALRPTVETLQVSAVDLFRRMIRPVGPGQPKES